MKAYIIDDEEHPRTLLKFLIKKGEVDLEIVGESETLEKGISDIIENHSDLDVLFLDIEMPKHSGLEIIHLFPEGISFEIIFVTAYSQYAIQAIKLSAFDYLLKPLNFEELKKTIERLSSKSSSQYNNKRINTLKNNLDNKNQKKYYLRSHNEELVLMLDEILYLEASGMYTHFYMTNKKITASRPLKEILNDLPDYFIRTHRSFAVNYNNILQPISIQNGEVLMTNRYKVPLSTRKKEDFLNYVLKK